MDLNTEAVQICQLSLWIKTAARGKQLTSLDHTIREGNSVISDPAVHPKAFDWQAAFPEVFAQGGVAVVVGTPPYIRQELLPPITPWLEAHYEVFHGMADLHASRDEYTRTIEPARALAAETLKLERTLSDFVNQTYALTPAEIALMWQTAPPRMPIPPLATLSGFP